MSKSRSLNKVMLIGNLTRSPIVRDAGNGIVVCALGLATNSSWKDKAGNIQERTEYHNLVAFNKLAEICANVLDVGMLVYIEGEIRNRTYEDSTGEKVNKSEIKINDMYLLDSKGKKGFGYENALKHSHAYNSNQKDAFPSIDDISLEETADNNTVTAQLF